MMLENPATDAIFEAGQSDDLARIVMALTQEVWVMRDRMYVTEKLLETKAGITPDQIDDFAIEPEMAAELQAMRDRYATKVLGAPIAGKERSVEQILERAGLARSGDAKAAG